MKKRVVSMALCAVMVVSMVGCSNSTAEKTETTVPGAYDEEAWKKEPAYGTTLKYWIGDSCTSACGVAKEKGYFSDEGLEVEGFLGASDYNITARLFLESGINPLKDVTKAIYSSGLKDVKVVTVSEARAAAEQQVQIFVIASGEWETANWVPHIIGAVGISLIVSMCSA